MLGTLNGRLKMSKLKISERVENIMRVSVASRNSDKELIILYMQKSGMDLSERQLKIFRDMPAFETITRIRRQLQEEGKYTASPEVEEARYKKYIATKQGINHEDPEKLLEAQGYTLLPFGE